MPMTQPNVSLDHHWSPPMMSELGDFPQPPPSSSPEEDAGETNETVAITESHIEQIEEQTEPAEPSVDPQEPTPPSPPPKMNRFPPRLQRRIDIFEDALQEDPINIYKLRELAFRGIPEQLGLRSRYWKILLGVVPLPPLPRSAPVPPPPRPGQRNTPVPPPPSASEWVNVQPDSESPEDSADAPESAERVEEREGEGEGEGEGAPVWSFFDHADIQEHLAKRRAEYQAFVADFAIDPDASPPTDHPLSSQEDSTWNQYFENQKIVTEIRKDVKRTYPDMHFFSTESTTAMCPHHQALERILYVHAKLNPGICYVQGMNELLAPIYFVFAQDPSTTEEEAEGDAFWAFMNLMGETRDMFCKALDSEDTGLNGCILYLHEKLCQLDRELWDSLEEKQIKPQFYGIRWLSLLLSQEFDLPDVLRIWDSLFSDAKRFNFLFYLCSTMIIHYREELLAGDFAHNIKLLQSMPPIDVAILLDEAADLCARHPP
eukprot:gnl/Trimastix_PCT/3219.p1 GENE.gnl/Trimastix_PCT/3219~~gnl/Trimastix_PCT/3219.p1  ORF type:complete len:488 (-),score=158.61 gnl/Trimastix_PCT/3219:38-1501(-)